MSNSADSKQNYSDASKIFVESTITSSKNLERYQNSKNREKKYNSNWEKNKVNLNQIVQQFTPNATMKQKGVKFVYENENYRIKADMPSGYLRIYDKKQKKYIKLDGTTGEDDETHFKILKRSEM